MFEKPWTEEDYRKKCAELVDYRDTTAQQDREKIRLWMQIQNEGRRVLRLYGSDIPIVCEKYVGPGRNPKP